MKLTKHEKIIIENIISGNIKNIETYIKHFEYGHQINFNKNEVQSKFENDNIEKTYYLPKGLQLKKSNLVKECEYKNRIANQSIDKNKYEKKELRLNYLTETQSVTVDKKVFTLNFYEGVYTIDNFDNVISFITLWQYLKSEGLILEISNPIKNETIGMFFKSQSLPDNEKEKQINYTDLTIDDKYYLEQTFSFSDNQYLICKDFIDKEIIATPKLKNFAKNRYKTFEEKSHRNSLIVAWVAIIVSMLIGIISIIYQPSDSNLESIKSEVKTIENNLPPKNNKTLNNKLDGIIKELQKLESNKSINKKTNTNN